MTWKEELHPRDPEGQFVPTGWAERLLEQLGHGPTDPLDAPALDFSDAVRHGLTKGALEGRGPTGEKLAKRVTGRIRARSLKPGHELLHEGAFYDVQEVRHGSTSVILTDDDMVELDPEAEVRAGRLSMASLGPAADAVLDYVGHRFDETNTYLRTGTARAPQGEIPPARIADVQARVDALDRVMAKSKTNRDIVVYRAVRGSAVVSRELGFMSTTASLAEAESIAAWYPDSTILAIHVPAGTGAVVVTGRSAQSEILLQRGLKTERIADRGMRGKTRFVEVRVS